MYKHIETEKQKKYFVRKDTGGLNVNDSYRLIDWNTWSPRSGTI